MTCTLDGVGAYDTVLVAVTSNVAVSSVADGGDTFTSEAAATNTGGTEAAFAYLYTAVPSVRSASLTITVTFGSTALGGVACFDLAGYGATAAHTSTGTGTMSGNGTSTFTSSVTSFTPTAGNFVISVAAGSVCNSLSSVTYPPSETPLSTTSNTLTPTAKSGRLVTDGGTAGAQCSYAGTHPATSAYDFATVGETQWNLTARVGTGSTTQSYLFTGSKPIEGTPTINPVGNWAEAAADFPVGALKSQSVTETVGLAVSNALRNPFNTETDTLKVVTQLGQQINREAVGLFMQSALAKPLNTESECLGIKVNITSGSYAVNTGPVCGAPVVAGATLTIACDFFQFQCWAIPLMYLGMIDGFFIGVAGAFRVSEKSAMYLMFAGLTWGSLVEISLGIMTPMLPIILIAMNIAYSFRLDKVVVSAVGNR